MLGSSLDLSLDSSSTTDVLGSSLDSNIMCRAWFKLGFELGFERHAWFELGLRCRKMRSEARDDSYIKVVLDVNGDHCP